MYSLNYDKYHSLQEAEHALILKTKLLKKNYTAPIWGMLKKNSFNLTFQKLILVLCIYNQFLKQNEPNI